MLRYALRRSLWLLPTLVVATYLLFAILAHQDHRPEDGKTLPLFINLRPQDARVLSRQALRDLVNGPNDDAERTLVRLGGVALPHVLPQLDALRPEERGRVAIALQPVAERMGLATAMSFSSPEYAFAFWTRVWEDRASDFRPTVVRRAVHRHAAHASVGRQAVLRELDTFVLGAVLETLGPCDTVDDVARVARLLDVAAHVTGREACVGMNTSVEAANVCILRWRAWWVASRVGFESLSGPERMLAGITETEFGHWALRVVTLRLGVAADGTTVFDRLRVDAPRTFGLALLSLVLAYGVAFPLGLLSARRTGRALAGGLSSIGLLLLVVPFPVVAVGIAHVACGTGFAVAAVVVSAVGLLAAPMRHQRIAAMVEATRESTRYGVAKGLASRHLLMVHAGKPVGALAICLAAVDFPLAISVACVVEHALGLPGLGSHVVRALEQRDLALLMTFGIASTVVHVVLVLASDMVCGKLDPRLNRAVPGENV